MSDLARGEVVLEAASRSFLLAHERPRTLKELFIRRSGERRAVPALDSVDLRIAPGEAVGVVGRNGAGKTSTLRCLAGIVPLDSGRAECGGRVGSLLELGAGFHPDFTGLENIQLNGALHGFGAAEIAERLDRIVDFSELGDFVHAPVKSYSSGMYLRLGFAILAELDADVLLVDEILAVGDESFQRKCLERISERMAAGVTLVLVSHDPTAIERVCRRVVVLDRGRVDYDGTVADGLLHYHRMLGTEHDSSAALRPRGADGVEPGLSVTRLEIQDGERRRRHLFRPGDELRVDLVVSAERPEPRAMVALEVRDGRGELCFRTDFAAGEVRDRAELAFTVPRLALLGGDYDLAVGVYGQDAPAGRMMDRVTRFSVADTLEGEGIADLRGSWTVVDRPAAEEAVR